MRIIVHHYRRLTDGSYWSQFDLRQRGLMDRLDPRGGETLVQVYDDDGQWLASGSAHCSDLDNYNKKLGRLIATGRAMKGLNA